MEHAGSIGAVAPASAVHAAPPAAPQAAATAHSREVRAAGSTSSAPSSASVSPIVTGSTLVSLSDEGQAVAGATSELADAAHDAVHAAGHLAQATLAVTDGLVGEAVHAAAGYAVQAGLEIARQIDVIA